MKLHEHQKHVVDTMQKHSKGQIIVPTGGGKTMCMIKDAERHLFNLGNRDNKTIVIVAPRILLAQQLCKEFMEILTGAMLTDKNVLHVHSGDTQYETTTAIEKIYFWHKNSSGHKLIFSTYQSLHKVMRSTIDVDTIYFDEAHNSVQKNYIEAVKHFSRIADRSYFFTATPKEANVRTGMNDESVFGTRIVDVPAPELVNKGYILPPKVVPKRYNCGFFQSQELIEKEAILDALKNEDHMTKVLVTAKSTTNIHKLLTKTDFMAICHEMRYNVMHITSKFGAIINGKKVSRKVFFDIMNKWGKDESKKFVMFHHSILSEGMNVSGLTGCILLRNLDLITMAQTIGRVIRLHDNDKQHIDDGTLLPGNFEGYHKPFGKMFVPVYSNIGIGTERRLNSVVDTIFTKGEAQVSIARK